MQVELKVEQHMLLNESLGLLTSWLLRVPLWPRGEGDASAPCCGGWRLSAVCLVKQTV